jgi:hypothetical protein
LFAKLRSRSVNRACIAKILQRCAKNFYDAISMRCFRLSDVVLLRAVDSGLIFAALPRVRARCGALRQAAPHFLKNQKSSPVRPARAQRIAHHDAALAPARTFFESECDGGQRIHQCAWNRKIL